MDINAKAIIYKSLYEKDGNVWEPFDGQIQVADVVLNRRCKVVFLRCGRGWSKSFSAAWIACKYALENPKVTVCIYAPELKQAKRIYWYPELVKKFLMPELIETERGDECFYKLINDSYIHIDGSDNTSQRGLKPNLVVADEYADFDPGWYSAMVPNVGKVGGSILFMGTPPEFPILHDGTEHHYVELDKEVKALMKINPARYFHLVKPTSDNPHYPKEEIEAFREQCERRAQGYVFRREMLAEIVSGSKAQIFPMFSDTHHVCGHEDLLAYVNQNPEKYEYICSIDPSTKGVFAVNVILIDRYLSEVIWLDEIHETRPEFTTPNRMCPRIKDLMNLYNEDESAWSMWCDNAAASFIVSAQEHHDMTFTPCVKQPNDKTEWLETLADILSLNKGKFSENCGSTIREFKMYVRDASGKPVKARDHHIDLSRYALKGNMFTLNELVVHKPKIDPISVGRMISLEKDLENLTRENDWTYDIFQNYE